MENMHADVRCKGLGGRKAKPKLNTRASLLAKQTAVRGLTVSDRPTVTGFC